VIIYYKFLCGLYMEYEFTFSIIQNKMKHNNIVAIDALDIKSLINHFLLWLPIELDIWLDTVNVHYVEPRSIYEFIALFNIGPMSTISDVICIAPT
jgi:hypothetical protein